MLTQAMIERTNAAGNVSWLAILAALLTLGVAACSSGGGSSSESSSSNSGGSTTSFSAPDCSGSTTPVAGTFTSDVPQWIQDNFKCINAYVSGSNVVIQTKSLPPYLSAYYGTGAALRDSTPPTMPTTSDAETSPTSYLHSKNPNTISAQTMTFTIPKTPLTSASQFTATYSENTADMGGIAVDGVAIFNAFAASPDNLSDEAWTMDFNNGHPTNSGAYHYHVEPWQLTDETNTSTRDALVGIALDGLPIYGTYDQAGTGYSGAGTKPTLSDADTDDSDGTAANFHCHETLEFPSGVCHYHVITGYTSDTTETVGTVPAGTATELRYMVKYFAGTKGSYTLAGNSAPLLQRFRMASLLATAAWCAPGGALAKQ